jgi:hypothetical protein
VIGGGRCAGGGAGSARGPQCAEDGAGGAAFFDEVIGVVDGVAQGCDGRGAVGIIFEAREEFEHIVDVGERGPGDQVVKGDAAAIGEFEERTAGGEELGEVLAILGREL